MKFIIRNLTFAALVLTISAHSAFSQNKEIVKVSVQKPAGEFEKGKQFSVDLTVAINSNWHINSNKPNDEFLIPSVVSAKGKGIKLARIKYPKPHDVKFAFSESPVSVYEGETKIGLVFEVQESAIYW